MGEGDLWDLSSCPQSLLRGTQVGSSPHGHGAETLPLAHLNWGIPLVVISKWLEKDALVRAERDCLWNHWLGQDGHLSLLPMGGRTPWGAKQGTNPHHADVSLPAPEAGLDAGAMQQSFLQDGSVTQCNLCLSLPNFSQSNTKS